ncbi:hypothetical protein [Corynebacterium capitovis]|uniref:hypothetical protein n=1 Tax=Corynebacterium capitovis TaxID=131081 RepID=UPI00035DF384|nr:hypothetical protein [Corynebacterium capitovis]
MTLSRISAATGTVLLAGSLLAACGSSDGFNGTWDGSVTPTAGGVGATAASVTIDGGDCSWQLTEPDGKTNDARCERDDEKFKLADPLTGRDLEYTGKVTKETLTLTPDNDRAEEVGVMVLTKSGK